MSAFNDDKQNTVRSFSSTELGFMDLLYALSSKRQFELLWKMHDNDYYYSSWFWSNDFMTMFRGL